MNVIQLWWRSLAIFAAVVAVVAALLGAIIATARSIDRHAAAIWIVGKQIAGNTVSIWILEQMNDQVGGIAQTARSIERTAAAMDEKLQALARTAGERG